MLFNSSPGRPAQPPWHQCLSQSTDFSHLGTPLMIWVTPQGLSPECTLLPFPLHISLQISCLIRHIQVRKTGHERPFLLSSLPSLFHQYNIIFKKHNSIIPNKIYGTLFIRIFMYSIHVFCWTPSVDVGACLFDVCLSLASTVLPSYSSTPFSPSKRNPTQETHSESDLF